MAATNSKVMAFVEEALKRSPKISVEELFEGAKKVSPSIGKLNKRQFHARYPLQVKRRKASSTTPKRGRTATAKARPARRRTTSEGQRDAIRDVFLQFATDMAAADDRKDLVKVLAGVDRYVDQVIKAGR
jgi:hypothetical protein